MILTDKEYYLFKKNIIQHTNDLNNDIIIELLLFFKPENYSSHFSSTDNLSKDEDTNIGIIFIKIINYLDEYIEGFESSNEYFYFLTTIRDIVIFVFKLNWEEN